MNTHSDTPPNYTSLRALLRRIDSARAESSPDALRDLLAITLEIRYAEDITSELKVYLYGSIAHFENKDGYFMYTKKDRDAARQFLIETAHGTLTEAAHTLEQDLRSITGSRSTQSDEFMPEYFSADDRKAWTEARKILETYVDAPYSREADGEAVFAVRKLRRYMEKYYGPLVPVISGSYQTKTSGVTVRIVFKDGTVIVDGEGASSVAVRKYVDEKIASGVWEFDETLFPPRIDEREFIGSSREFLFEWEL